MFVRDGTGNGSSADFVFPDSGQTLLTVTEGDSWQASFDTDNAAAGDNAAITKLTVTSGEGDVAATFDDTGRPTTSQVGDATLDITYNDADTFDYTISSGEAVVISGTATLTQLDASVFAKEILAGGEAPARPAKQTQGQAAQGISEDFGVAIAACVLSFRQQFAHDAVADCSDMVSGSVDNCYETCLSLNPEVTDVITSICIVSSVRGLVASEEESSCLARNDRPESECHRLGQTSDQVLTYLSLLYATAQDVANSFRSQDNCPYGDVDVVNLICGNVDFRIIDECPNLAEPDSGQDNTGDTGGTDGTSDNPVVCDANSVPPDPDCFDVVDITDQGGVGASSEFGAGFEVGNAVDGDTTTSWFSDGGDANDNTEVFTWQLNQRGNIYLEGMQTDPEQYEGGGHYGFGAAQVLVLDGSFVTRYDTGVMTLAGSQVNLDVTFPEGTVGNTVQLLLFGHQSPTCGGFAELRVYGYELKQPAADAP